MSQTLPAALICRVSSREQEDGYSLEAQERLLRDFCERQSFRACIIHSFSETASKHHERAKFRSFMDEVVKRKISQIVVEKVDRLSRGGLKEAVMMDEWLEKDSARHIHFVKDTIDLHKLSRSGDKLNWGMRVILAKNQTDNLREEVLKATDVMLKSGIWPTSTPLGYIRDRTNATCPIQPDPEVAPLIRTMFELYDSGEYSIKRLTVRMEELGLRGATKERLHISRMHRILTNPFYRGLMRYRGKLWPGIHQPLVSQSLFERVQERVSRKTSVGPIHYQKHVHRLSGVTKCGCCKKPLAWEIHKGVKYGYCKQYGACVYRASTKEEDTLDVVFPLLAVLRVESPELRQSIYLGLKLDQEHQARAMQKLKSQLKEELQRHVQRLARLLDLRVEGEISKAEYEAKKEDLTMAQANTSARLRELESRDFTSFLSPSEVFARGQEAAHTFELLSPVEQRRLLNEIFTVVEVRGTLVFPQYKQIYEVLARAVKATNRSKTAKKADSAKVIFEFLKTCSDKQEHPPLRVGVPVWQAHWEDFRSSPSSFFRSFS